MCISKMCWDFYTSGVVKPPSLFWRCGNCPPIPTTVKLFDRFITRHLVCFNDKPSAFSFRNLITCRLYLSLVLIRFCRKPWSNRIVNMVEDFVNYASLKYDDLSSLRTLCKPKPHFRLSDLSINIMDLWCALHTGDFTNMPLFDVLRLFLLRLVNRFHLSSFRKILNLFHLGVFRIFLPSSITVAFLLLLRRCRWSFLLYIGSVWIVFLSRTLIWLLWTFLRNYRCLSTLRMSFLRLFLVSSYIPGMHRYWKHRIFGDNMVLLASVGCWYSDFFAPR